MHALRSKLGPQTCLQRVFVPYGQTAIAAFTGVAVLVCALVGCGRGPRSTAGKATLVYWQGLMAAFEHYPKSPNTTKAAEAAAALKAAANKIHALPTLNVDPEAVQLGLQLTQWLEDAAAHRSAVDSPAMYVDAFVQGFAGNPTGPYTELRQNETELTQRVRLLSQRTAAVRASLTARYEYEFPQF